MTDPQMFVSVPLTDQIFQYVLTSTEWIGHISLLMGALDSMDCCTKVQHYKATVAVLS